MALVADVPTPFEGLIAPYLAGERARVAVELGCLGKADTAAGEQIINVLLR